MLEFIRQNAGTIIVGIVVLAIIAAAIVKIIRDKRSGKCNCSCEGCSGCDKKKSPKK